MSVSIKCVISPIVGRIRAVYRPWKAQWQPTISFTDLLWYFDPCIHVEHICPPTSLCVCLQGLIGAKGDRGPVGSPGPKASVWTSTWEQNSYFMRSNWWREGLGVMFPVTLMLSMMLNQEKHRRIKLHFTFSITSNTTWQYCPRLSV